MSFVTLLCVVVGYIEGMKCPECGSKTEVKQTRQPDSFGNRYLSQLSDQWPDLVCRRRHCSKCEHRRSTVEISVADLQQMFLTVASQAVQMGEDHAI